MDLLDTDSRPLVLSWEVTQARDCDHCCSEDDPDRPEDDSERDREELTTEEGKTLLEEAAEFGEGQLVVLSGCNLVVRADITELVRYGDEQGLYVTMTLKEPSSLTVERIEALSRAGLKRMAVSLDGATADTHDAFRGESGSFDSTLKALEESKAVGLPVEVNTTVCRETVDELPAIRNRLSQLGVVMWSVRFPTTRESDVDPVSPTEADSVMNWLADVTESVPFGINTIEAPQYRRVSIQRYSETRAETPHTERSNLGRNNELRRRPGIVAGDGLAFVSATGEVYPSSSLDKSAGNVCNRPITDIYRNSNLFGALRDRDRLRGKCGSCPYRTVCGGSRSRAFATTGDPLESDPLCPYVPDAYDGPLPWLDGDAFESSAGLTSSD